MKTKNLISFLVLILFVFLAFSFVGKAFGGEGGSIEDLILPSPTSPSGGSDSNLYTLTYRTNYCSPVSYNGKDYPVDFIACDDVIYFVKTSSVNWPSNIYVYGASYSWDVLEANSNYAMLYIYNITGNVTIIVNCTVPDSGGGTGGGSGDSGSSGSGSDSSSSGSGSGSGDSSSSGSGSDSGSSGSGSGSGSSSAYYLTGSYVLSDPDLTESFSVSWTSKNVAIYDNAAGCWYYNITSFRVSGGRLTVSDGQGSWSYDSNYFDSHTLDVSFGSIKVSCSAAVRDWFIEYG